MGEDTHDNAKSDQRLSAASKCIVLSLSCNIYDTKARHLDEKPSCKRESIYFRPVYTHQCFEGEYIPGYRPVSLSNSECQREPDQYLHSSLRKVSCYTNEIEIKVELAASCQASTVKFFINDIHSIKTSIEQQNKLVKRQKLNYSVEHMNDESENDSFELLRRNGEEALDEENVVKNGYKVLSPLSTQEIIDRLSISLPPIVEQICDDQNFLTEPIGQICHEYKLENNDFESYFVLTIATSNECSEYHSKVQNLALFFIESADTIDVCNKDGGYWKVMYLFQKHSFSSDNKNTQFSFVGYMTLYHFNSPFRKPVPGTVLRICQVLILPPYQRAGHGRKMLHTLFELVCDDCCPTITKSHLNKSQLWNDVVEVNVEDPSPDFVALRDRVDYERFIQSGKQWFEIPYRKDIGMKSDPDFEVDVTHYSFFKPLSDAQAINASLRSITTQKQAHVVYEIYKLGILLKHINTTGSNDLKSSDIDDLHKKYRLMVKQRLNKQEKDILSYCKSKQDMKDLLAQMYDTIYRRYTALLEKVTLT